MPSLIIVSTDTEVGKTFTTCAIAAYYQTYFPSKKLGIMKLIQCGSGDSYAGTCGDSYAGTCGDRELYANLFELEQSPSELNPLYFDAPLAPPLAAARIGKSIDLTIAWQNLQNLQQRCDLVLIEGLGGLGSPVTAELTLADIAHEWRLPALLVVPVKLGSIGQAVANVALANQAGVDLRGIILNCAQAMTEQDIADFAPADLLMNLTRKPVLGCLPYLAAVHSIENLAQAAASLEWEVML
jgi:dethiobiotin synthetase